MVNIYQIFGKVLFKHKIHVTINDPLPVLPSNEQDLGQENIDLVNTYLFYQVCTVHDIVCLGDQSANIYVTGPNLFALSRAPILV